MSTNQQKYHIGQTVDAWVEDVFAFGVFVRLEDDTPAYVRQRELTLAGNVDPHQVVNTGDKIEAKVILLPAGDRKLELSVRQTKPDPWESFVHEHKARDTVPGEVKGFGPHGVWVAVAPGVDGLVPWSELTPWPVEDPAELLWPGDFLRAMITQLTSEQRRLRLSIRRQLLHEARVQRLTGQLREDDSEAEEVTSGLEVDEGQDDESPVEFGKIGRVLVLDDHDTMRHELVVWLERHGCQADGFQLMDEALDAAAETAYELILVDLDLDGRDGLELVRAVRQASLDTHIIVMSIPEWIAERVQDLEALGVTHVFAKPLDMDEVRDVLGRLARGEEIGPFGGSSGQPDQDEEEDTANSFQPLARTMRSGVSLADRLAAGVAALVQLSRAELGILFHLEPDSRRVCLVACDGHLPVDEENLYALSASPVGDLIRRSGEVYESGLSPQSRRRFQKLLEVVQFEACVGVPVPAGGRVEHALFLFHRQPDAFSRYRLRDAHATAALLGVALESEALENRIREASPFLLSGHLATGFGHDVYNKMSALELQVRNLRAGYDGPTTAGADPAHDVERLLETTLDLKETVGAFRQLVRAEDQVELDVNQVVRRALRLLSAVARRQRIRIELDLAPDLPCTVGSPVRLQQVFLNVMLNAIQHIALKAERWPEGWWRLHVATGLEAGPEPGIWVRFSDTGPGIHRRSWESIFALGYSTRPGGTGLGLFIARSLIESMGGRIFVEESAVPLGTTFRADLPTHLPRSGEGEGA